MKLKCNKTWHFVSFFRSPCQRKDEFEDFNKNLGLHLENIVNESPKDARLVPEQFNNFQRD